MTAEITLNAEELLMLVQRNGSADQYPNISHMVSALCSKFAQNTFLCALIENSRKAI